MRAEHYKDATSGRFSLGNVGLEWLAPSFVLLVFCWGVMFLFQIRPLYQMIVLGNLVVWPFFTFSFLHDAMHLRDFWMARVPLINRWFRRARRLHDIHHHSVNGTVTWIPILASAFPFRLDLRHPGHPPSPLNRKGLAIALQRYKLTMSSGSLRAKALQKERRGSNDGLHGQGNRPFE